MNKKTKYKKICDIKATVISAIIMVLIISVLGYAFYRVYNIPIGKTGVFENLSFKIFTLFIIGFLLLFSISGLVGCFLGYIKAKLKEVKENSILKKSNPYIYYRELPNNYGIGVTTLLFDSTIENYKDIVAVILDLCARKYLNLVKKGDKYEIKVLKGIDDKLLDNEKYILNLIISGEIKKIDYEKWYKYCMNDGIELGLYTNNEIKMEDKKILEKEKIEKQKKKRRKISLIISLILSSVFLFDKKYIETITNFILFYIILNFVFMIIFYIKNLITSIVNIGILSSNLNYQNMVNNTLARTEKGNEELQKLYSFKAFIKDFGNFVNKKPEEVILWDRYLSYAQVFGLTKEILSSGYEKIINNSSFSIDNFENINLDNIYVKID